MTNVWVVRADFGKYTDNFISGGYAAIGWIREKNLSEVNTRDELYPVYREAHPDDTSNIVVGQQVGQIARFLLEIKAGDYIITPPSNTEWLHYGQVEANPAYFYEYGSDGCPYPHRRRVNWADMRIRRPEFSIPFQNAIRSSLTVFKVSQGEELLNKIGVKPSATRMPSDPYRVVLNQILELDAAEFEILVGHLLTALGFEGSEVTGKTGDGGVDVTGELNVSDLAKVKVFVQVKRYKVGAKVSANIVKQLRASIPSGGQGAFITTADYQAKATEVALELGFPRIGLIDGHRLVDLLIEHWESIPAEFHESLGLRRGLVRS